MNKGPFRVLTPSIDNTTDTICAVSTPSGVGGIAVIRMSGSRSFAITEAIFKKKNPAPLQTFPSHTAHYGEIFCPDSGNLVDEVLLLILRAPRTYTREDMVEIHCHGGLLPVRNILKILLSRRCRLAQPGEFTLRAFLNGRLDLAQAEAVMDLITSTNERGMAVALNQLQGNLSTAIQGIGDRIMEILVPIEAGLDFPEEDIHEAHGDSSGKAVWMAQELCEHLRSLMISYDEGKILKHGLATAILGRPNVGKSSLLNRLLGEERAIVTEIPGTTRDVLEEMIQIEGVPLRIIDMAGIRRTSDPVEQEGVRRAEKWIHEADFILLVLDAGESLREEDHFLINATQGRNRMILLNKGDKKPLLFPHDFPGDPVIVISALYGTGIDFFKKEMIAYIRERFLENQTAPDGVTIVRLRHREALRRTQEQLQEFRTAVVSALPVDIQAFHLRSALDDLGEIIGTVTPEGILERIFSEFCIGK